MRYLPKNNYWITKYFSIIFFSFSVWFNVLPTRVTELIFGCVLSLEASFGRALWLSFNAKNRRKGRDGRLLLHYTCDSYLLSQELLINAIQWLLVLYSYSSSFLSLDTNNLISFMYSEWLYLLSFLSFGRHSLIRIHIETHFRNTKTKNDRKWLSFVCASEVCPREVSSFYLFSS